jgi:hypothetical protein
MKWDKEVSVLKVLIQEKTLEEIGEMYGVTRQRMYQVLEKYGIETPQRRRKNFLKDKEPKYYWLNKMLCNKGIVRGVRQHLLETLDLPTHCPILGIKLNYDGSGEECHRGDDSPSIDRIDSSVGYLSSNVQVISWRANRIKNDSTPEELRLLADYMEKLKWL